MRLSWKFRNAMLWLATVGLGASACFGIPTAINWLESGDDLPTATTPKRASAKSKSIRDAVERPSEEQLAQASSANLQRMNPPKPIPPPEKPVVAAEPPPPTPVVLFQGTLVGTILDSDPKYCFALIKVLDNRLQLVAQGQKIESPTNSATLVAVQAKEVTIKMGEQQQTLKVAEEP